MNDPLQFNTADEMAQGAAGQLAIILNDALDTRGRAMLVLSGGSTPKRTYQYLAQKKLDWSRVTITLADDRWVKQPHAASNAKMLAETLFGGDAKHAQFIDLVTDDSTPEAALQTVAGRLNPWTDAYDAVVLGMGQDGHTASLFPRGYGMDIAMDMNNPLPVAAVTPNPLPHDAPFPRMTLTLARLLKSRHHMLLISGTEKHRVFEDAILHDDPARLPIAAFLHNTALTFQTYWTA